VIDAMQITGFVPLASHGFALPVYRSAHALGNAFYVAVPSIEGDHRAAIMDFEVYDDVVPTSIVGGLTARIGDPWIDVFLREGQPYMGTPRTIYDALTSEIGAGSELHPLSFLDLALAAGESDLAHLTELALNLLRRRAGIDRAHQLFVEAVARPGILLEIYRLIGDREVEQTLPAVLREFHVALMPRKHLVVTFAGGFGPWLASGFTSADVEVAIRRLCNALGLSVDVHGLTETEVEDDTRYVDERPVERQAPTTGSTAFVRSRLFGLAREIAIDLGTDNTRIYAAGRGVILEEPSIVAIDNRKTKNNILAVGTEAKTMISKTPMHIDVIRPLLDGALIDADIGGAMIKHFVDQVVARRWNVRPLDVIVCAPAGSTSVERRAIKLAANAARVSRVYFMEAPLAAAIGADLPVLEPVGSMVVNIGGGTTEIGVVALRALAYTTSVRVGGHKMDRDICTYFLRHHNLAIGELTAENIKKKFGTALPSPADEMTMIPLRGHDTLNRVPKEITVSKAEIGRALQDTVATIIEGVRIALENTAPELAADIMDEGIVLTGGGALLDGMKERIKQETGLPVYIAQDPLTSVARGIGRVLEDPVYRSVLSLF
jgi:rod shape-determining protein MreB